MSEDDCRKAQMEARILATENEISRLRQDLKLSQKALDEGSAVLEAIYIKHQRDVFITFDIYYLIHKFVVIMHLNIFLDGANDFEARSDI